MKKVTLHFKSIQQLWQFKQAINTQEVEVNFDQCTLTCHCDEKEVQLAIDRFNAKVLSFPLPL
jgi:hypothetical protein